MKKLLTYIFVGSFVVQLFGVIFVSPIVYAQNATSSTTPSATATTEKRFSETKTIVNTYGAGIVKPGDMTGLQTKYDELTAAQKDYVQSPGDTKVKEDYEKAQKEYTGAVDKINTAINKQFEKTISEAVNKGDNAAVQKAEAARRQFTELAKGEQVLRSQQTTQDQITALPGEIAAKEQIVRDLEAKQYDIDAKFQSGALNEAEYKEQTDKLRSEINEARDDVSRAESQKEALKKKLTLQKQEKGVIEQTSKLLGIREQSASARELQSALENNVSQLENELEALRNAQPPDQDAIDRAQAELNEAKDQLESAKELVAGLANQEKIATQKLLELKENYFKATQRKVADQRFDISTIARGEFQKYADASSGNEETLGLRGILTNALRFAIVSVGAVALLGVIVGAIILIIAAGDETMVQNGKTTILYSIIGLVLVLLSYAIVSTVQSIVYQIAQ